MSNGRRPPLQLSIVVPIRLTTDESAQQTYEMLTLDRIGTIDESYFDTAMELMPPQLGVLAEIDGNERWQNLSPPPNYETFSSPETETETNTFVPISEQLNESGDEPWTNLSPPPNYNKFMPLAMVEVQ